MRSRFMSYVVPTTECVQRN
uniref:Uncharacterized protein n=1 Tax=Anopheles dirus TaxID=7168 RepID=A0A182NYU2_9DIPT